MIISFNRPTAAARIYTPPPPVLDAPAILHGPQVTNAFGALPSGEDSKESLEEAKQRIALRFDAMARLGARLIARELPSLVVSGPPGLGKTFTFDRELAKSGRRRHDGISQIFGDGTIASDHEEINEDDDIHSEFSKESDASKWYDHISGGCTAPGLYQAFWHMRNGGVVLIDDADSIFYDMESLNLLKIATDSSKQRVLSWRKRAHWLDALRIARSFEFKGHVAFLTNIDFEQVIKKHTKDTEHYKALIDRARYLCLTLRTQRDFMIRIRQVAIEERMLEKDHKLTAVQAEELLRYIDNNKARFYNLSLRLVGQIADDMAADPLNWEADVIATKMKTEK